MSNVMVIPPILSALVKSEDVLGAGRVWSAVNALQSRFLDDFFIRRAELFCFSEKELRAWASMVAADLNEILAREGFSIRLSDFNPGQFGVVSILDVMAEWLVMAGHVSMPVGKQLYPAVHMLPTRLIEDIRVGLFNAAMSSAHPHPLVRLNTKSGDSVCMTIADHVYDDFELMSRIDDIRCRSVVTPISASWLMFPMVDLDLETSLDWMVGMHTVAANGDQAKIISAVQQTKFKMNHLGARVKSAVGMGFATTSVRVDVAEPIIIDEPFFLWIERPGLQFPLMYGYIDEQNWNDPGDIARR
ncbi:MAG: hypothetical protein Q8R30_05005 [bacterium]|nr:hypothetical protein [bacterium]MDZ4285489.1 hypothetical protein [Candidatus Sungbacteria bacterium]